MTWGHEANPAGWLYGAIVAAALFTLAGAHPASYERLLVIVTLTLVMYWMSHVYVRVIADRLADPSATFRARVRHGLHYELSVLWGGVPAVLTYLVFVLLGWTSYAAYAALWTTVVLLGVFGYRVGVGAGATGVRLAAEVLGCSLFGIALIGLKVLVH
jgi:hypothetical protein